MRVPVFIKILAGYVAVIALLSVVVLALTFHVVRDFHMNTLASDLTKLARSMSGDIAGLVLAGNEDALDAYVKDLGRTIETRITVIDSAGKVLADSENDPKTMENHKARKEIADALSGSTGRVLRFSRTVKEDMLYVAIPLQLDSENRAVLRVSMFAREIKGLQRKVQNRAISAALLVIIVSLGLAIVFSRNIAKPIRRLVHASQRVAAGEFNVNVILKNSDEFKELADSYNHMVSELRKLVGELHGEKEALDAIINSIGEAIVVLDKAGRVRLFNNSFKSICKTEDIKGRSYWELVRSPSVGALLESARDKKTAQSDEFEISGRYYLASAAAIGSSGDIVLSLRDFTEVMKLATMKKDFIVNVSHELRTPLTAIKGFVETIEEEGADRSMHYLEIIKRHTDRLISIVKDLQQLSELESVERIEKEKIDLGRLLLPITKMFEKEISSRGIGIELNVKGVEIYADPYRIEQVFINLIDNSVKYTKEGKIRIAAMNETDRTRITVEDTGIGIPAEHIPRIFERFYVADKSHSRKMGGTGLGLSIVKHIVLAHRGTVNIESEPGRGTKVMITLPRNPTDE